ncbi:putative hemerythrin HHE cation-binding domain-containing protein [Variovorax paradoxus B4]|uniref:Putative hemerythrin HHE cation-binding domain-containing protein n=1 Tax=Variovorax paradoxus B4 TaxID=1246301 RepID=T1X968_VARPD|nr:hemerythrin domain-containing protein [Variovorax paradoxus]AGU49482.1 putative hemerythrin HHE cation-binding domain-containing protein [Variovorax paradoxus B4]
MLAAECAWAILRAEHVRTRELLARLETAMKARGEASVQQRARAAIEVIERLQAFEETTHRPKGVVMLNMLRGRSSEADRLLDQLDSESECCSGLLSQAKTVLERAEAGNASAAVEADALLQQHRQFMYVHLDKEDTLLHSQTALLLTAEEWAAVVSSISKEVGEAREREHRRPPVRRQVPKPAA